MQSHINKFKDTLYTSSVGEVVLVNYEGDSIKSVDVRPSINRLYIDGEERQKPVIFNVPLLFPSGGGGIISFPIQVGDTVLLVFGKEDIQEFLKDKSPRAPNTLRKFSYNDAIAIPCLTPFVDNLQPSKDAVEIKYKGASVKIDVDGNVVVSSTKDVIVKSAVNVSVTALETITVKSPTLVLDCEDVSVTGSLAVSGNISTEADISTSTIPSLNNHKHENVRVGTEKSGGPVE
jgi:hypothetical protein